MGSEGPGHCGDPDFQLNPEGLELAVELLGVYAPGGQDPGRSRSARLSGGLPETGGLGRSPGGPSETPGGLPEALGASELPETGIGSRSSLGELARPFLGEAADLGNPGSCAHMDPPTPWVSWAAALWAASRNQNLLHPDTAPVARDLEAVAIRWIAPYFGMGGGHLVPGSTVANLTALWAARELRGVTEVVASEAAHVSLRKAANLLGLAYRSVRTDGFDRLDPTSMGDLRSACLVLTAGTTVMGSIDPLDAGQDAAWRHLDAAWAGPLRFSHLHRGLLDGVEAMDSVSVSAHKLMFQPKESAMVLFADVARSHAALSFTASYLSVPNVGLLGSHGATALGLVATLLAWGRAGLAARIERCMDLAVQLDAMVVSDGNLERLAPPATGIVLWRPKRVEAPAVRDQLRATSVSLGLHQGEQWLRCVFANPNGDPALLVDEVRRVIGLGRPAARAS